MGKQLKTELTEQDRYGIEDAVSKIINNRNEVFRRFKYNVAMGRNHKTAELTIEAVEKKAALNGRDTVYEKRSCMFIKDPDFYQKVEAFYNKHIQPFTGKNWSESGNGFTIDEKSGRTYIAELILTKHKLGWTIPQIAKWYMNSPYCYQAKVPKGFNVAIQDLQAQLRKGEITTEEFNEVYEERLFQYLETMVANLQAPA